MKNTFYFILKALFVPKISQILSQLFGHVDKRLDWKDKVNFNVYDVNLVNKQFQYKNDLISQEVKAIRQ